MTVETATYIGQLSPTYPTGSDAKSEGDSHLRLIKSVLQAQFTSLGNAPVTATAAQLNALVSASGLLSVGTSTTSNSIGTGSKTFTTQTGLGFAAGQAVRIQDNASLSNYMLGTISSYTTATGSLVVTVDSTAGSGTIADWSISLNVLKPQMSRRAITTTDTVSNSDWCGFVDITSGTFTLSFSAAATLGAGFWCIVRNSGTGDVTLDPDGSETIDGLTSFVMYPGESRLIQCTGSALFSILLTGFNKTFSSSGTFTKPPGYTQIGAFVQGPGGGGGSGRKTSTGVASGGGGGGAGAWVRDIVPSAAVSSTETVTVGTGGAGGAGQTSNDTNGNNGSNGSGPSSFGTLLSAAAGNRGDAGSTVGGGGGGGGTCAGAIAVAGTAGGAASASGANTGTAATTTQGATGGGGGGGYDGGAAYAPAAGGASGTSSSASQLAGGTAGAAGATGTAGSAGNSSNMLRGGTGGGGGGYGSSGSGGAGGAGVRGGGGGGGGACSNTGTSGAGGAGGDGVVVVWGIV